MKKELQDDGHAKGLSDNFIRYIWEQVYEPQLGYGFSIPHTISYSLIALQELNLAYKYPLIYWNCASLCIDAGAETEDANISEDDFVINNIDDGTIAEDEKELEQEQKAEQLKKKVNAVDYARIATALNNIISLGVKIVPPDINKSQFSFVPDAANNRIIYGLSGIEKIGKDLIKEIIAKRPFTSVADFCDKIYCNRTQTINLIKAGTFDNLSNVPKRTLLYNYIAQISELKNNLTLANANYLINKGFIPSEYQKEIDLFLFNKTLRQNQKEMQIKDTEKLFFKEEQRQALIDYGIKIYDNFVYDKEWREKYRELIQPIKDYILENKKELLYKVNYDILSENLLKYAVGNESEWEMKSISFYYSGHELSNIQKNLYNIKDFYELPEEPEAEFFTQWKGKTFPIFKLNTIAGTVIGKNKIRHTIAILTTTGVINIKFHKEIFNYLDKQISIKTDDGKKKVMEKSWFARGTKLLITGIRRGDQFVPKVYKNSPIKMVYLIKKVNKDGTLILQDKRFEEN